MRKTLQQFRVFLESNRFHGRRDRAPFAPGARRRVPLPAGGADPGPVGARQMPAASGGAGVPDGAVPGARHGDRLFDPAVGGVAGRRVAPLAVLFGARLSATSGRRRPHSGVRGKGQHRRAGRRRPHLHDHHLLLALQLRRTDLQRHLAGPAAPDPHRQVPDVLRDGHAAADAGRVFAVLVGRLIESDSLRGS